MLRIREQKLIQPDYEIIRRASDHGPAARINGVRIPILQHPERIFQRFSDAHESLNWKNNETMFKKIRRKRMLKKEKENLQS